MKKFLIIALFLAGMCFGVDDTIRVTHGNPQEGIGGYPLDSLWVVHYYESSVDTLFSIVNGDSNITVVNQLLAISGTGNHRVSLWAIYDGFPGEVYEIAWWDRALSVSADLAGKGPYSLIVFAVDTSGTDDTVSGVTIKLEDATGTEKGNAATLSDGAFTFKVDSGSYTLSSATMGGYYWNDIVCTVSALDTIAMVGWNIPIGAPSGDSVCRVYGYAGAPTATGTRDAIVTWSLSGRNIYDVCNGYAVVESSGSTETDSTGLWTLDLVYSQCLERDATASAGDSTLYKIIITYPSGLQIINNSFNVPSADSVEFTW